MRITRGHQEQQQRRDAALVLASFKRQATRNVLPEFDRLITQPRALSRQKQLPAVLAREPESRARLAQGDDRAI